MAALTLRKLEGEADIAILRALRLEALRVAPSAFAVPVAQAEAYGPQEWLARLQVPVFAAFLGEEPVGLIGLSPLEGTSARHRMTMNMVFVRACARGRGVADQLVNLACNWAQAAGILQVELIVTKGNEAARQIYLRSGFVEYGLLPRGRCIDGVFVDDIQMVRMLD